MKHLCVLVLLLLASSPFAAWAGTAYKWVDAEGNVHYSEQPPPKGMEVQKTFDTPQPVAAPEPPPAEPDMPGGPAADVKKPAEKGKDDVTGMTADELRQRNCKQAQEYLASLQRPGPVALVGKDDKVEQLSTERRAEETKRAQEMVEKYCAAAPEAKPQ